MSSCSAQFLEPRHLAAFQGPLRIQEAIELDELGHKPGPTGLMAGTATTTRISVEIFVEQYQILPVRI